MTDIDLTATATLVRLRKMHSTFANLSNVWEIVVDGKPAYERSTDTWRDWEADYQLPPGYTLGESIYGYVTIYDPDDARAELCDAPRGEHPMLLSPRGYTKALVRVGDARKVDAGAGHV